MVVVRITQILGNCVAHVHEHPCNEHQAVFFNRRGFEASMLSAISFARMYQGVVETNPCNNHPPHALIGSQQERDWAN